MKKISKKKIFLQKDNKGSITKKNDIDLKKFFEDYTNNKPYQVNSNVKEDIKNYTQMKEIDIYSVSRHPKIIRHKYHPSSKIFSIVDQEEKS